MYIERERERERGAGAPPAVHRGLVIISVIIHNEASLAMTYYSIIYYLLAIFTIYTYYLLSIVTIYYLFTIYLLFIYYLYLRFTIYSII